MSEVKYKRLNQKAQRTQRYEPQRHKEHKEENHRGAENTKRRTTEAQRTQRGEPQRRKEHKEGIKKTKNPPCPPCLCGKKKTQKENSKKHLCVLCVSVVKKNSKRKLQETPPCPPCLCGKKTPRNPSMSSVPLW